MPKRLNSRIPMMERRRSFHWEKLSPSQWALCLPLPTNVDRLKTNALFPVACWTTLQGNATRSSKTRMVTKTSYNRPEGSGIILSERALFIKQLLLWSLLTWKCGCKTANKKKIYTVAKTKQTQNKQKNFYLIHYTICLRYFQSS